MKRNLGIIDRILRLVALHFLISIKDIDVISSDGLGIGVMCLGLYLVVTLLVGFDPFYRLFNLNTRELSTTEHA